MYVEKYKKTSSNLSTNRINKKNVEIQPKHVYSPFIQTAYPIQHVNKPYVIQRTLKVNEVQGNPEITIEDLDDLMEEIYYGELEKIDREKVKSKIIELIQSGEDKSFEKLFELKDYLVDYFFEQSSKESVSDEPVAKEPFIYTGILSMHPYYHRKIKPAILHAINIQKLQKLLRNKNQTNFDFYIQNKTQIWVSNNGSRKAEKDTGYDIIFDSLKSFRIVKRASFEESDEE